MVINNEQFEDIIEQAFWEFDNLRTLYSDHVLSERDKFKRAIRIAKNKILELSDETSI